jgi:RNA polymerase sigma-70 factor (ECF subfamily)
MSPPPADWGPRLERYRSFLRLQARLQLHRLLQSKLDASDIVQETMRLALERWDQYHGETDAEFGSWLQQIHHHVLVDAVRRYDTAKRKADREQSLEALLADSSARMGALLAGEDSSPSQRAVRAEELLRLANALEQLPQAEREAVILHHLLECPVDDVASKLGRSGPAAASLLQRALKRLRGFLQDRDGE